MRKGSLSHLLTLAVLAMGSFAYAASPVLDPLPVIVISDEENNTATQDFNLFVYTDAFAFGDYVVDADTPDNQLSWSFFYTAGSPNVGSIEINGKGPLASPANATAPGASSISFPSGPTYQGLASFRETTLSPTSGTAPFAAPGAGIRTEDVNNDGSSDKVVGDIAVTFFVVDDQASTAGLASGDTFVYTIDTNPSGTGAPAPIVGSAGDSVLSSATGVPTITFTSVPLDVTTASPALGVDAWKFVDWAGLVGSATPPPWLWNATSATEGTGPNFTALRAIGAKQTTPATTFFSAAFGTWSNEGTPLAQYAAGNIYSIRATMGWASAPGNAGSGLKTADDNYRIYSRENTLGSKNNQLDINAPNGAPHGTAANATKAYQLIANPVDSELVRPSSGPNTNLFYTVGYDWVNTVGGNNLLIARLTNFEIGSAARAAYTANQTSVKVFGNGSGESAFNGSANAHVGTWDGWGVEQDGFVIGPAIGNIITGVPASGVSIAAGTVNFTVPTTAGTEYIVLSNFAGFTSNGTAFVGQDFADDVGSLQGIIADATYLTEYAVTNTPASGSGRPDFEFRHNYYNPAFVLRGEVFAQRTSGIERPTQAFPSGNSNTFQTVFTAPEQYAVGSLPGGAIATSEDDLQVTIGTVNNSPYGGTVSLTKFRLFLLGEDDPNVDY